MKQAHIVIDDIVVGVTSLELFYDFTDPNNRPTAKIQRIWGKKEFGEYVQVADNFPMSTEGYFLKNIETIGNEVHFYLTSK